MNQQHHLMVNIQQNITEANMFNVNLCPCSWTFNLNVWINKINIE